LAAIFVACGSGDIESTAVNTVEPAHGVSCVLSGPSSGFPVRVVPGIDLLPTEIDGVNTATCTFSAEIIEVKVTLFHVEGPLGGFEAISDSIAMELRSTIEFPIAARDDRMEVSSLLPIGRYVRRMEAVTESGELIEIQTELGEVATEVFLVDAPNATIMWRSGNKHSADQDA
jgi:hypothetical protein